MTVVEAVLGVAFIAFIAWVVFGEHF